MMPRQTRVLPDWVKQSSKKYEDQMERNLMNATKALKQKKQQRKQRNQQRNDNNTNNVSSQPQVHCKPNMKPSTPPPMDRPDSIPDQFHNTNNRQNTDDNKKDKKKAAPKPKAKVKTKPKPKAKAKKKVVAKKKKNAKNKRRKNKNNLMLDTDEDEWSDSSGGSVGSLAGFIIEDDSIIYKTNNIDDGTQFIDSEDEEYDVAADINEHRHYKRKRYRSFDSNGDLISNDDDDLNESFGSLLDLNGGSYNSMIIHSPPKKKRKGIRTVCDILPLCQYGEACYRTNLKHFSEYAHPWKDKK